MNLNKNKYRKKDGAFVVDAEGNKVVRTTRIPENEKALSKRCMPAGTKLPQTVAVTDSFGKAVKDAGGNVVTKEVQLLANRKQRRSLAMDYKPFMKRVEEAQAEQLKEFEEKADAMLKAEKKETEEPVK